jgi:hypothetical protein
MAIAFCHQSQCFERMSHVGISETIVTVPASRLTLDKARVHQLAQVAACGRQPYRSCLGQLTSTGVFAGQQIRQDP